MIQILLFISILLTSCSIDANYARNPKETLCEEKYSYDENQQSHTVIEHNFPKEVQFFYYYSYEETEYTMLVLEDGTVLGAEENHFFFQEESNWDTLEPITQVDKNTLNHYVSLLQQMVSCKPMNVDTSPSFLEVIKEYHSIYGVRGEQAIMLYKRGDINYTTTDENAEIIANWMQDLWHEVVPSVFPHDR